MNSSLTSQPNEKHPQTPAAEPKQIFPGEVFGNTADFDAGIRQLLPRYDEMLDTIVRCIPNNSLRILELGCGTGELSLKILNRYPSAQLVALDYSPRMLQFAQEKIHAAGYAGRVSWVEADFGDVANNQKSIGESFNSVVSSLAIHHLKDEMKLKLFKWIHQNLNSSGCFWNADPILPESGTLAEVYKAVREEWANNQGTTLAEVRAKLGNSTPQGHSNPDQLATLTAHLEMLRTAGFEPAAVPWKYYGLAVFGGFKA